jgi:hypothetical protein
MNYTEENDEDPTAPYGRMILGGMVQRHSFAPLPTDGSTPETCKMTVDLEWKMVQVSILMPNIGQ